MSISIYKESDYNTGEFNLLAMEKKAIIKALRKTKGNKKKSAELLEITARVAYIKIKQHSINANLYKKKKLKYE